MTTMKAGLALLTCPLAALTASALKGTADVANLPSFAAGAWKSDGSELYFYGNRLNARGGKFYVNEDGNPYCPDGVASLDCSQFNGRETNLVVGGDTGTASLDVTVPGGQQVYLAPDGSLSFTQAHSAYIPEGSTISGFYLDTIDGEGPSPFLFNDDRTWYLCPVGDGSLPQIPYQVVASEEPLEECVRVEIKTYTPEGGPVWQFN
ncbi:hypothetical protein GGS20DRAFT_468080 [Poronia punctata]|nr:hypothetical protein GGS20DRAFT_468080 [Poronia punctata]